LSLPLRDYQRRALDAIHAADFRGLSRVAVVAPTGSGKTVAFAHLILERGERALVLAHRDELVRQAADKIRMIAGIRPGIVKAVQDEVNAQVVVASVQTLARPARLRRLLHTDGQSLLFGDRPAGFRTVVVDELHHYVAGDEGNTFGSVLEGLGCFGPGGPLTVGFTATPERSDGSALGSTWQEIVFSLSILDGIRGGWLSNIRAKQIQLAADFSKLHVRAGEFRDEESADMLMAAEAPKHAAAAYLEHAKGRKALVFTPTVAVAKAMAEAFRVAGVTSESVDGEMPLEERRAVLRRLSTGETMVVPNCAVLLEGFDEPSLSCIVMACPTRSRVKAIQAVGRGTRVFPGKADLLVLDLVGSTVRMDLITVAQLFDVSPEAAEAGVVQAIDAKAGAAINKDVPEDGRLVSVDVDLFAARAFAWVQAGLRFILQLGEEDIVLEPSNDPGAGGNGGAAWDVFKVRRVKVSAPGARFPRYQEERQKLFTGLDIGYGMGAAEDYARRSAGSILVRKDVAWRKDGATDKQRARLERWGLWQDGMTKGQANDIIGRRIAQRVYGARGQARRQA